MAIMNLKIADGRHGYSRQTTKEDRAKLRISMVSGIIRCRSRSRTAISALKKEGEMKTYNHGMTAYEAYKEVSECWDQLDAVRKKLNRAMLFLADMAVSEEKEEK